MDEHLTDLFEPLGAVVVKRMFGGKGVWLDGMMFALVFGETIYLKVDDQTREAFVAAGSQPFVYHQRKRDRQAALPYFSLPEEAQDDPVEASRWARLALGAVLRSKAPKKGKKAQADIGPGPWDRE